MDNSIVLLIVLNILTVIYFFIRYDKKNKQNSKNFKTPKGWFVYECGQSPLHMLWHIQLINLEDSLKMSKGELTKDEVRRIWVEERNTLEEAFIDALYEYETNYKESINEYLLDFHKAAVELGHIENFE